MNIIFVASEVVPFAKTGGLADVAGSLPRFVEKLGHSVSIMMPLYAQVRQNYPEMEQVGEVFFPVGESEREGQIYQSVLPDSSVTVYFIANDRYFDREELYGTHGTDYPDNSERFIFFSRAVVETLLKLDIEADVVHCNDWQTGLIPVYLRTIYNSHEKLRGTACLFTIHNIAYQGVFWHWDMKLTGLPWSLFNWRELEFYGKLNFMKGGIVFADIINTVSERYAQEIQTEEQGYGLDGVLRYRSDDLYGVLNGIDYSVWNPATDKLIPANYDRGNMAGKKVCKEHLQKRNNLPVSDVPLIGMITRLAEQKGLDLVAGAIEEMMKRDLQFVLLGTGDKRYHDLFEEIGNRFPEKAGINLTFDNELAHQIEAGADMFLMPSRYEPCGLNQLYSLRYGTVPIVRRTGGLADTITDYSPEALATGEANGFAFDDYSSEALLATVDRALEVYADKESWRRLVDIGMGQDWSWNRSAKKYVELYEKAIEKRKQSLQQH